MAGGHGSYQPVKLDPAIDRWVQMKEDYYKHFKWTTKTTRLAVILGLIIPGAVGIITYRYDNKFDFTGKRREDSLWRTKPKPADSA